MASRFVVGPRRPHLAGAGIDLLLIFLGALLAALLFPPGMAHLT